MTTTTSTVDRVTDGRVRALVKEWYEALDRHDPLESVLEYLAPEGLEMTFPEGKLRGTAEFADWYRTVTHRFFDEVHELVSVDPEPAGPGRHRVRVVVNWQARIWEPPTPNSTWLGFVATQTWTVVDSVGGVRIVDYIVDELAPMPGSGSL